MLKPGVSQRNNTKDAKEVRKVEDDPDREKRLTEKIRSVLYEHRLLFALACLLFLGLIPYIAWSITKIDAFAPSTLTVNLTVPYTELLSNFTKTITQMDIAGNVALFEPSSVTPVLMWRLMTFLTPPGVPLSLVDWADQLDVFFGELATNFMTLSNPFNITGTGVSAIGYYAYTIALVGNTTGPNMTTVPLNLPTVVSSFTIHFEVNPATQRILSVEVLQNATATFVWYGSSGVEPPGPFYTKKRTEPVETGTLPRESPSFPVNPGHSMKIPAYLKEFWKNPDPSMKIPASVKEFWKNADNSMKMPINQRNFWKNHKGASSVHSRAIPDATRWSILLSQIDTLLANGQQSIALSICNTTQFLTLQALFDPYKNETSVACNFLQQTSSLVVPLMCSANGVIDGSCLPDTIATINTIGPIPVTRDYTIVPGPGIQITGLPYGIHIKNTGLLMIVFLSPHPEFIANFTGGILYITRTPQLPNTVMAGPESGPPVQPGFRYLVDADIPYISAYKVNGTLVVAQGGTGSSVPLVGGKFMISYNNTIVEGPDVANVNGTGLFVAGPGIDITLVNGSYVITATPRITLVDLVAPSDIFNVTSSPVTDGPAVLTFVKNEQSEGTFWAGPIVGGGSGVPVFRPINVSDLPSGIPVSLFTGVLPIANGGTNSNTTLLNDRIIISYNGQLVEAAFLNGTGLTFNVGGGGGGITIDNQGLLTLSLAAPADLFSVGGSPTSGNTGSLTLTKVSQSPNLFYAGPTSGLPAQPTFRAITAADLPLINLTTGVITGVLPIANGGTGNPGPLVGNRLMVSDATGSAIVEFSQLFDGYLAIGSSTGAPVSAPLTAGNGIGVQLGSGSITIDALGACTNGTKFSPTCVDISSQTCTTPVSQTCIPTNLVAMNLAVSGNTTLGTETSCSAPLNPSCIDISGKSCPGGYIATNCINPNLVLDSLYVTNLIAVNSTQTTTFVANATFIETQQLVVTNLQLNGSMTCSGNTSAALISHDCYDISNKTCPNGALSESCIPDNLLVANLQSTNTITINNLVCSGPPIPSTCVSIDGETCTTPVSDSCVPMRIRTINGALPTALLDFTVTAGTGISVVPGANQIIVSNTGVTSVALALPVSLFSISGSPVTTTGTLTGSLISQAANTIFAAPDALAGIPSFRAMVAGDLPALAAGQLFIGTGSGTVAGYITAGSPAIIVTNGAGTITVDANVTIGMTVPAGLLSVSPSSVTNSGTFSVTLQTQSANTIFAGPAAGAPADPTFRAMVTGDLPPLTNGQLYIGNAGVATASTLTAGAGISITNGAGSITIASTIFGTVTSVALALPVSVFSISGSPVTSSGTLTGSFVAQAAATIFAGPTAGAPADPTFRAMAVTDLPALGNGQLYIGNAGVPTISSLTAGLGITITPGFGTITVSGTGGTVTSVGLSLPVSVFSVSGSPVTSSGTLTGSFTTQTANTVFAGPASGGPATPTFRALTTADITAALNYQEVSSTTTIAAFSAAGYTLVTTMTITPAAGTYQATFSSSMTPSTTSGVFQYGIFNDAAIVAHSQRTAGSFNGYFTLMTQAVVTVNGSQAINVRWRKSAGSGSGDMFERSLFLLRIA